MPDAQWNDWRWQLSHRLNSVEELGRIINLTPEEAEGARSALFRVLFIRPIRVRLIDPDDPHCPIRRQVIPTSNRLIAFDGMVEDSLNEDANSPVPGFGAPLSRPRPDAGHHAVRELLPLLQRSRLVGDPSVQFSRGDYDRQIDYIARTPQIDVLLSGGDPLVLRRRSWRTFSCAGYAIEHVEIIRIGTRAGVHARSGSRPSWLRCCASSTRCG